MSGVTKHLCGPEKRDPSKTTHKALEQHSNPVKNLLRKHARLFGVRSVSNSEHVSASKPCGLGNTSSSSSMRSHPGHNRVRDGLRGWPTVLHYVQARRGFRGSAAFAQTGARAVGSDSPLPPSERLSRAGDTIPRCDPIERHAIAGLE